MPIDPPPGAPGTYGRDLAVATFTITLVIVAIIAISILIGSFT